MKPDNIKTKIFLDSGDPKETVEALELLGFLDGQTTNPTLIAKNPDAKKRIDSGNKFSTSEIYDFYHKVIKEISALIPDGSVSIEVYADNKVISEEIAKQAKEMFLWIPNAHIKLPITVEGLKAAEQLAKDGIKLNMTLCFSQEQAAAVHAATLGAKRGDIFISPFVGRFDDRGENGMDLIKNILKMYNFGKSHVEVLAASVRNLDHFLYALSLDSDIITAPLKILKEWKKAGMPVPEKDYVYKYNNLKEIPYKNIDIRQNWNNFNIGHELTDKGIESFSRDWNNLIK